MTPSLSMLRRALSCTALREVAIVLISSVCFAFIANHFSPRSLSLSRDYFPPANLQDTPEPTVISEKPKPSFAHEFANATRAEVEAFTRDKRFVIQKFVLIDARSLATYQAGHIPGALQYDHFRPAENIARIAPACLAAEKIILYCHGGTCEDSIFAARLLVGYGVPAARLMIYEAGFHDWQTADLPIQSASP
jgi:rhodanese-related sulfurtransferase